MLTLSAGSASPLCNGLRRRDFLRIGALGLGGLSLADLKRAAAAEKKSASYLKDKSVVFLFLAGGPSQYETFDPKPDGPEGSTSIAGHIPTRLPGVRFASYLPKLAKLADRLTIVRSFKTNHAEHNGADKQILTADLTVQDGKPILEPGLGAVYTRVAGSVNPANGMLRQALIPPTTQYLKDRAGFAGSYEAVEEGAQPAWLGAACAPFKVFAKMSERTAEPKKKGLPEVNPLLDNLQLHLKTSDLRDRMDLLKQLDQLDRRMDTLGEMEALDQYGKQAVAVLQGEGVRKALDLSLEDNRTLATYDTEHFRNWNCDEASKFIRTGPSIGFSLGRQLLMARRLCEAGCGFVTVINANWDFHARKNIPNIPEGMGVFGPPLDHAVSAFLEDLEQRGLSEKILLVITGEFGRTPGIDKNLGRHHWPKICPLVFAGGGLKHGQVVGQSDKRGGEPATTPYTIADLHATILNTLVDVGQMRVDSSLPNKIIERAQLGKPIAEMF